MQFSEAWLRSLVNTDLSSEALGHLLTMAGLELEGMQPVAADFTQVVVAEILSAEKHPNADRLHVCRVRVGEGDPLQIVCGAPNARAGLKTACALVGASLPGIAIKQAKVRGVESFGMLCSAKELGIDAEASGIMELPVDAPVGSFLRAYLNLDDHLVTLKMTPNRGDCLSMLGLAREVTALTGTPMQVIDCTPVAAVHDQTVAVSVSADQACPRYVGRIIRGIDPTARTPSWMAERLARSGLRCIHPVVDVTNYVLIELGEPMHAFDLAKLKGGIQVRMARAGEQLALLNDQTIELAEDCTVIADDTDPLALAGVMGGAASAVSDSTCDIFLEAAHFTPAAIAGRARRFGLSTDSSHRFERGVDPTLPAYAMERATRLILDICGGSAGPVVEGGAGVAARPAIAFRPARARRLLGVEIADAEIRTLFGRLGLQVEAGGNTWQVLAPAHRFDLNIEVDLIEEVARLHGYEQIPATAPLGIDVMQPGAEALRAVEDIKNTARTIGYQEVVTYSFISPEQESDITGKTGELILQNPIASHLSTMRSNLMAGLLQTLKYNLNYGQDRLRLFELGRCFESAGIDGQPLRLGGLAYGAAWPEQWAEKARGVDFYDVKGDVEALFWPMRPEFKAAVHPALHPGQCAAVHASGRQVGWIGSLHPRLVQKYGLARAPILFEIDVDVLMQREVPHYQQVSRLPSVRRDLAVVVDAALSVGEILSEVRGNLPEGVTEFALFDVYQGQGVGAGKKSLAFRMLLQHTEKTLTDEEIEQMVSRILEILTNRFNATLRG